MLHAGVARVDVTPPVGVRMAGFSGRTMPSLAVHDPLYARCLALDDGRTRAALVALDLIYADADIVADVRRRVAGLGLTPESVLVAASHTHSGPRRAGADATDDENSYWAQLAGPLASVIEEAFRGLTPVRLSTASGWAAVGINRRRRVPGGVVLGPNEFGIFDPELGLVRLDREDGSPLAAVMNYACHGVSLLSDNLLLSADYPGFAVHLLQQSLGSDAFAMFFNGACGNINPRELGVSGVNATIGSFVIAQHGGSLLAQEARRVWDSAVPVENPTIACGARTAKLPTNPERALRAAEAALEAEKQRTEEAPRTLTPYDLWDPRGGGSWAQARMQRLQERGSSPVEAEVQAVTIGSLAFTGWPGEIFCEHGMAVKRRSPFTPTYTIGYANGSIGYVPTAAAYQEGGYEPESALLLDDHAGEVLVDETVALLEGLKR
jgi:Neutral/alkaline non-lysosomal ceramidase, N-terminal